MLSDDEEKALITEVQVLFEQHEREVWQDSRGPDFKLGRDEGRRLGRQEMLARQFAWRLGRPLSVVERAVVAEQLDRLGHDGVFEVVFSLTREGLAAWLAAAAASFKARPMNRARWAEMRAWWRRSKREWLFGAKCDRCEVFEQRFERGLGRDLSFPELLAMGGRLDRLGEDRVSDVLATLTGDALAAWLADPEAR